MKLTLWSTVKGDYRLIYKKFDRELFEYLAPPKFVAQVARFDGSEKGNLVIIDFLFPVRQQWVSEITQTEVNETECFFIDEGRTLPFGILEWRHKHRILNLGNKAQIRDEIQFTSGNLLKDVVLYALFLGSFLPRVFLYKTYFNK